jgi:hypothetical protein
MLATALPGDFTVARCRRRVIHATMLSSHAGDNVAGVTWLWCDVDAESCWQQRHRDMLPMALPGDLALARCRCRFMQATLLSSHAGDGAARATSPRRDVDAESCWRQCYRVMLATVLPGDLAMARCRCRVMWVMVLSSHAGDGPVEETWPRCDVNAESCWR